MADNTLSDRVIMSNCWTPSNCFVTTYDRGGRWIWYGEDNNGPEYLQGLLRKSYQHSCIINGIIKLVIGKGFIVPEDPEALRMYNNIGDPRDPDTKSRIHDNSFDVILSKIAADLVVYGAFSLNPRWGAGRAKVADVHAVEVESLRIDKDGDGYWLSNDWSQYRKQKNTPVQWQEFSDRKGDAPSQIMYRKMPSAINSEYAIPYYFPVAPYIEMSNELAEWQINRLANNFAVSSVMNYPVQGEPEEVKAEMDAIRKFYSGGKNAGKTLITYGDTKVTPFDPSRFPEDIVQIQKMVDNAMRTTHGIISDLFGMGSSEGGGITFGKDILTEEYEAYDATMIAPFRKVICEAFNLLSKVNGVEHVWEIEPYELFELKPQATAGNDTAEASIDGVVPAVGSTVAVGAPVTTELVDLNGAQIEQLTAIVTQVTSGILTPESAIPLIEISFPRANLTKVLAMIEGAKKAPTVIVPNGVTTNTPTANV